jgi:hypothetical protein
MEECLGAWIFGLFVVKVVNGEDIFVKAFDKISGVSTLP